MTDRALKYIADSMNELGINYSFAEWKGKIVYPYFVGEYQEAESMNEDGMEESTFILTGFSRSTWADLEEVKKKIKQHFNPISGASIVEELGNVIVVFYNNSLIVPNQDAELKKIQINLTVKEWSVI